MLAVLSGLLVLGVIWAGSLYMSHRASRAATEREERLPKDEPGSYYKRPF